MAASSPGAFVPDRKRPGLFTHGGGHCRTAVPQAGISCRAGLQMMLQHLVDCLLERGEGRGAEAVQERPALLLPQARGDRSPFDRRQSEGMHRAKDSGPVRITQRQRAAGAA